MKGFTRLFSLLMTLPALAIADTDIPDFSGMPFNKARNQLLESGWTPTEFKGMPPPVLQIGEFRKEGFTEVTSCSGAEILCTFMYADANGDVLELTSKGRQGKINEKKYIVAGLDSYRLFDSKGVLKKTVKISSFMAPSDVINGLPVLAGMSYRDARPIILQAGWEPLPSAHDMSGYGQDMYFRGLGYTEVESCSGGASFCIFNFRKTDGTQLRVVSIGEEDPKANPPYFAIIDHVNLVDPEQEALDVLRETDAANKRAEQKTEQRQALWQDMLQASEDRSKDYCTSTASIYANFTVMRDKGYSVEDLANGVKNQRELGNMDDEGVNDVAQILYEVFTVYSEHNAFVVKNLAYQTCRSKNDPILLEEVKKEFLQKTKSLGLD